MGSTLSHISAEAIIAVLIAGAAVYAYVSYTKPRPAVGPAAQKPAGKKAKGKKKEKELYPSSAAENSDATSKFPQLSSSRLQGDPVVVPFPRVVPGDFDPAATSSEEPSAKSKKGKKQNKKAKSSNAAASAAVPTQGSGGVETPSPALAPAQATQSRDTLPQKETQQPVNERQLRPSSSDTDSSWTRVKPHRQKPERSASKAAARAEDQQLGVSTDFTSSDFGPSTTGTGDSPVAERTVVGAGTGGGDSDDNRRTLAEKLLPKPRKTGVDDVLERSDYPGLARVMRVQPRADETPAAGFSWKDYEDVDEGGALNDADEDEGEWGVVKGKSRSKPAHISPSTSSPSVQKAPETLTKRQRQNANKRAAEKAAKAETDALQQARFSQHKRELERAKILEQVSKKGGRKTPGGGMQASVDTQGHMVFD
ncbi:hypothetical protein BV22DRAFT_1029876 [Leucogyrophana mollusca]|uniref:Uncharacterized protein n=1 Tax=Leucogyrophana mollusca TaxID=85980 RepID=A0ACB8BW37_9AGAM|nr:hypothetical protein BV22DRAFT_1029876 [Leucogyrophana mollusca]